MRLSVWLGGIPNSFTDPFNNNEVVERFKKIVTGPLLVAPKDYNPAAYSVLHTGSILFNSGKTEMVVVVVLSGVTPSAERLEKREEYGGTNGLYTAIEMVRDMYADIIKGNFLGYKVSLFCTLETDQMISFGPGQPLTNSIELGPIDI